MGGYYWHSDNPNCGRCGHLNGRGFCNMTACIYPVLPQTAVMTKHHLTNAERIRAMTDEELADFIGGIFTLERDMWGDYDPRTVVTQEPRAELRSREDALDWLKQEAKE